MPDNYKNNISFEYYGNKIYYIGSGTFKDQYGKIFKRHVNTPRWRYISSRSIKLRKKFNEELEKHYQYIIREDKLKRILRNE